MPQSEKRGRFTVVETVGQSGSSASAAPRTPAQAAGVRRGRFLVSCCLSASRTLSCDDEAQSALLSPRQYAAGPPPASGQHAPAPAVLSSCSSWASVGSTSSCSRSSSASSRHAPGPAGSPSRRVRFSTDASPAPSEPQAVATRSYARGRFLVQESFAPSSSPAPQPLTRSLSMPDCGLLAPGAAPACADTLASQALLGASLAGPKQGAMLLSDASSSCASDDSSALLALGAADTAASPPPAAGAAPGQHRAAPRRSQSCYYRRGRFLVEARVLVEAADEGGA